MEDINTKSNTIGPFPDLIAYWNFKDFELDKVVDLSGHDNYLYTTGSPNYINDGTSTIPSVELDGKTQWLSTESSVIKTDGNFSIAAWVRITKNFLDSNPNIQENAFTAVSQDSDSHAGFYLGVRRYKVDRDRNNNFKSVYRWCFAMAPISMDLPGVHVCSKNILTQDDINKWVFIVAVCDVDNRLIHLNLPSLNEENTVVMQDSWKLWNATKNLQIGRGQWSGQVVDQWEGDIGSVRVFNGVLSFEQAEALHYADLYKNI